ncbi:tumor necrosis factor ligand superfamily member 14 [Mastacembelus armatus]|uniref:TNF superfamily member 14 n=1 Tax=Mastacembelus armatus TaxID=205130 RepID=A0A3Q3N1J3_9TELE|nr:tumor necrosis factor ligand superfamily member 14-like [Mastacembelus armatus]XP_026181971.1 tumor necrosis factor ligand superfamily member 14-like [Mastacembelus armatus]XP_026181973.1 tumor necrosis factor ligand superfamily member 14-like [Mastacembelus armatus]XP_026181974.1 tumor necrosis factor ligand superfamily member 14-like [Mastacembelus armatus]
MAQDGYPSVFVVDSQNRPPIPPRLNQKRQRTGVAQTILVVLVCAALCGIIIEACFIYRLYQVESTTSASSSKLIGDEDVTTSHINHPRHITPSKPVAHLTDGQDVVHGQQIMAWSVIADPILYEMDYIDKHLVIQKEGYYYVYSKVYFLDNDIFHHSVEMHTKLLFGQSVPLLLSRKYSNGSNMKRSNSYLGGVFHFSKDDAIFVKVSNASKIVRHKSIENIFGAYMI